MEKAARIKQQLGGSGDYADPDPERPKGTAGPTSGCAMKWSKRNSRIKTGS